MRGLRLLAQFALVLIQLSVVVVSQTCAEDYYVNNLSGADAQNGRGPTNQIRGTGPFKTIARALRAADGGDRIFVANAGLPYRESITLQGPKNSGNDFQRFQLIGDGAIIDGSQPVPEGIWEHFAGNVFKFKPEHPRNQILFRAGRPLEEVDGTRIAALKNLKPLQWSMPDSEIYFCVDKGKLPDEYELSLCGNSVGVTLYQVHDVTISGLIIQGFRLDGINAHDLVSNATVERCSLRGNGRSGLSVGGASRLKLDESVVGNNRKSQLRIEGYSRTDVTACDLIESELSSRILLDGGKLTVDGTAQRMSLK